ncbi:MAG: hypothetical protein GXC76_04450 [Rhodanobacteraceae bacterium]|nr:hypothetical protein [Rhodanobacteraceae bacterium]
MIRSARMLATALALVAATATAATSAPAVPPAAPKAHRAPSRDAQVDRWLDLAGFGEVALYAPRGVPRGLVLFASGDGGWHLGVTDMAHEAAARGYWVAGFSTPAFLKALDAGAADCSDADGALARLGDELVRRLGLPPATRPLLVGYSSGATVVYAALAADAGARFDGGISLGFCPDLLVRKPFCPGRGGLTQQKQKTPPFGVVFDKRETVAARWRILQGEADQVCDPVFAPAFAADQADAQAILLPKVGHGFGVPRNWLPQYRQSLDAFAD